MPPPSTPFIQPLSELCLRFRHDLQTQPRYEEGRIAGYVVEDPLNGRFYRLGPAEHELARALDGKTTVREALRKLSQTSERHALTEEGAVAFAHWLFEMNLASRETRSSPPSDDNHPSPRRSSLDNRSSNPLGLRFRLFNPDRLLDKIAPSVAWLFAPATIAVWLIALLIGVAGVALDFQRFQYETLSVFSEAVGWLPILGWLVLKCLHEFGHAVACKRFGGSVREAGLQCSWFIPMPYIDVTSSWRFESMWSRVFVATAGIYFESWMAILGSFVWLSTESGPINHIAYHLVLMAGISTVVFNANPLMKLDGYYVFSDLVGIPNLYRHGQRRVYGFFERLLLDIAMVEPSIAAKKDLVVGLYGWLSLVWRVVLGATIILAFANWAGESGVWLALILLVVWLEPGVVYSIQLWWRGRPGMPPQRVRATVITTVIASMALAILCFVPWPIRTSAPAMVEDSKPASVRAAEAGWIEQLHVEAGEYVETGTPLLTQSNPILASEVEKLRLTIQQCELRELRARRQDRPVVQQAEAEKRLGLQAELEAKESKLKQLFVTAPHSGVVYYPDRGLHEGRYLQAGDEILSIVHGGETELRVAISQTDFQEFTSRENASVVVDLPGEAPLHGRLVKIIPRATLVPLDPALTSVNGGELPVRPISAPTRSTSNNDQHELLTPHLEGIVQLDAASNRRLFSGRRGTVYLAEQPRTIGEALYRMLQPFAQPK